MRRLLLSFLLALVPATGALAQSYEQLWKGVEAARDGDLPRSGLEQTRKIYDKAVAEGNAAQIMRVLLTDRQLLGDISPDSLAPATERLEAALRAETRPVEQALWRSALGQAYAAEAFGDTAAARRAAELLAASLRSPEALAGARTKDYLPLFRLGESSSRFYADDLLSVLTQAAAAALGSYPLADAARPGQVLALLHATADCYVRLGRRPAALLALLDVQREEQRRSSARSLGRFNALLRLAEQYADLPENVETYAAIADLPADETLSDSMQLAAVRTGIARYGKEKRAAVLRNFVRRQEQPALQAELPQQAFYPGDTCTLRLRSRNLRRAVLVLRRLPLTASDDRLRRPLDKLAKLAGKAACSVERALPQRPAWAWTDDSLSFAMPSAGIYLAELAGDGKVLDRQLVYATRLKAIVLSGPQAGKSIAVVDAKSGAPRQGAKVAVWKDEGNRRTQVKAYATDGDGFVQLGSDLPEGAALIYVSSDGDAYLPDFYARRPYSYPETTEPVAHRLQLYADRNVYRPGQTVRFGGVAFTQRGDSTRAAAGSDFRLTFHDARGRQIGEWAGRSDEWGSFGGEFATPAGTLPGRFSIRCASAPFSATLPVRVEAYKRPVFTVELDPVTAAYALGDTVRLTGTATTYTGLPLDGAAVRYEASRSAFYGGGGRYAAAGETVTDERGRFVLPVPLVPDSARSVLPRYDRYVFSVTADVTIESGETVRATAALAAATRPAEVTTDWPETLCRDALPDVRVNHLNASYRPVPATGAYVVTRQGQAVATGTFAANEPFRPAALAALPSGRYVATLRIDGATDTLTVVRRPFVLFSSADTRPATPDPWFVYERRQGQGDTLLVLAGSGCREATLFYEFRAASGLSERRRIALSDSVARFTLAYRPEYGDGATLCLALVRDGRLYSYQGQVEKPAPRKQLTLRWSSFRSRLVPGQEEEWRLSVLRPDGTPVRASVMARLYDASLRAFGGSEWSFGIPFSRRVPWLNWTAPANYPSTLYGATLVKWEDAPWLSLTRWDESLFLSPGFGGRTELMELATAQDAAVAGAMPQMKKMAGRSVGMNARAEASAAFAAKESAAEDGAAGIGMDAAAATRKNFAETAFFHPSLATDSAGTAVIAFTLPQSLTMWAFDALAHDVEMNYGLLDTTVVARKDFMVQGALPRFLRAGDETELPVTLRNLTDAPAEGRVACTLIDAATGRTLRAETQKFRLLPQGAQTFSFAFAPDGEAKAVVCRLTAASDRFSDGEEHLLPVLSDRVAVTRALPFSMKEKGALSLRIDTLWSASGRMADRRLTVETVNRPAWYAVMALPPLARIAGTDALSRATRYYAAVVAARVAALNPAIAEQAEKWRQQGERADGWAALLERNADLKQTLLDETPWAAQAETEAQRMAALAALFDAAAVAEQRCTELDNLRDQQLPDGSWPWFKGMGGSASVTSEVALMLARLEALCADGEAGDVLGHAMNFLEKEACRQVAEMKAEEQRSKRELALTAGQVRFLYVESLLSRKTDGATASALNYLMKKLERLVPGETMETKALRAAALAQRGRFDPAKAAIASLMEHTVETEEMGRCFDTDRAALTRAAYKIPTQTAAIEALLVAEPARRKEVEEMRLWLMQSKRAQMWETSRETADAVYALLAASPVDSRLMQLGGKARPLAVTLFKGRKAVSAAAEGGQPENPAGYARQTFVQGSALDATDIRVEQPEDGLAWGAVYAQYTLPAADVQAAGSGFSLARSFEVKRDGRWQPLVAGDAVKRGEKVREKLVVRAERDFDFVSLKSARPACLEPLRALSGVTSEGGLTAYRAVHDASTERFFERLPKGTHVLTEEFAVDRTGCYSCGTAFVQCIYAPEFSAQAGSFRISCDQ